MDFRRLIPTFSPQGDGNHRDCWLVVEEGYDDVDPYLFPARGRKQISQATAQGGQGIPSVDPYLFPARGRKHNPPFLYWQNLERLIPTFSPQGDGNPTTVNFPALGLRPC